MESHERRDAIKAAREAGFDHYLTKPLALAELLALVRRLLAVRR